MLKGTKLYSSLYSKCPVCHKDDLYVNKNSYVPQTILKMHDRCNNCNTKYAIEPSFFYGAMYVSYTLGVALGVALFVISYFFLELDFLPTFFIISGGIILLLPLIMRLSRNIWLNIFFKFDKTYLQND